MAGTALVTALDKPVPAHIAARLAAEGSGNIIARATVNALTFEGKVWAITLDGKKTKLMRTNADGEEEPVSTFTGIVLAYSNERGREWYAKAYDPKNPTIPDCWSEDSKAPHDNVPVKVAKTCAACPNAKKGSASTQDGNPTVACGQFQKIAVIPAAQIGAFPPLRLRLKITSIYDKSGIDKHPGWHAWQQYLDNLVSKGINNTHYIPTKMKFDTTAYPKLLFATGKDWLDEDTLALVEEIAASDATKDVLTSTYDPATSNTGNKPLPEDDGEETELPAAEQPAQARAAKPAATPAKPAAKPKAAPAPAVEPEEEAAPEAEAEEDEEEVVQPVTKPAKPAAANAGAAVAAQAKAASKAAQARQQAPAAEADEDGDEATAVPPPKAKAAAAAPAKPNGKAAPAAAPAKGTLQAPAEVADLMQDWDD